VPEDYTKLAALYDTIGMADFGRTMLEDVLDYALANDWLGQRVIDFGCGTGAAAAWLSEDRFSVVGIDQSNEMLDVARSKPGNAEWVEADIRSVGNTHGQHDLVLAFDVLNEMDSLKDVGNLFQSAYASLADDMLFVFDVHTIEGLTTRGKESAQFIHDGNGVTVLAENTYDYERQSATRNHTVFVEGQDGSWIRQDTQRVLRGYPLQVIATLLQRAGFSDVSLLDLSLTPVRGDLRGYERVIAIARR